VVAKGGGGGRNQQEHALRGERNCREHWCQNRELTRKITAPPSSLYLAQRSQQPPLSLRSVPKFTFKIELQTLVSTLSFLSHDYLPNGPIA
jgi:hypothetical protein